MRNRSTQRPTAIRRTAFKRLAVVLAVMGYDGGMIFDARPYQPDALDRQRARAKHPLGENTGVRAPWLPTPPEQAERNQLAQEQAAHSAAVATTSNMPVAGRLKGMGQRPTGAGGHAREKPPPQIAPPPPRSAPQQPPPMQQRQPPQPPQPMPPQPMLPPGAAAEAAAQEQPSMEDLFALYRLCGGDAERVVELLARLWNADPAAVAPTVHAWLGGLPHTYRPPPSRMRTAPPALPSWFTMPRFSRTNGVSHDHVRPSAPNAMKPLAGAPLLGRPPNSAPVKPIPLSAPVNPQQGRQQTFDMMMLQQAVEKGSTKLGGRNPNNRVLQLGSMPEDEPVSFSAPQWQGKPSHGASLGGSVGNVPNMSHLLNKGAAGRVPPALGDDALGAFMYASRVGKGIGVAERSGGVRGGSYGGRHMR